MPLYVNGLQVVPRSDYHFYQHKSKTRVETVWGRVGPRFDEKVTRAKVVAMLNPEAAWAAGQGLSEPATGRRDKELALVLRTLLGWMAEQQTRRFANDDELARTLVQATNVQLRRNNYYTTVADNDENKNPGQVIYGARLPGESAGWAHGRFFEELGSDRNDPESDPRNAEQEYLLQNMVKGALYEAAVIADRFDVGISVRGTGLLAHMGIESGDPTKAQEYKNKTSKEVDLFLCNELKWEDLGAVVHYDPRVGWQSARADLEARTGAVRTKGASSAEWVKKRNHMKLNRIPQLKHLYGARISKYPETDEEIDKQLRQTFMDRAAEYVEEDHEYRLGHFAPYTELVGPYVRLKLRPKVNQYGDHDLFGFTMLEYGRLIKDTTPPLGAVQMALQSSNAFQAQHGGVWNWEPKEEFHKGIKNKIMGSHSPPKGDPLVYILPGFKVNAAFYIPGPEVLKSVWDLPSATEWLKKTYTGKRYAASSAVVNRERDTGMLAVDSPLLAGTSFP